jgi:hypothetical protein
LSEELELAWRVARVSEAEIESCFIPTGYQERDLNRRMEERAVRMARYNAALQGRLHA